MKINENQKGFGVVEILLVIVVIGLIVAVGWLFFDRQQSKTTDNTTTSNSSETSKSNTKDTNTTDTESAKTTIYPNIGTGVNSTSKDLSYSVELPTGWSVQSVFEDYDIVKTIGNDKYLISSFIEHNGGTSDIRNLMEQRVAEGIKTIATVKTNKGTSISVLQTPTALFLASCVPTGENCYLNLNGKDLYIHLYQVIPHAQSASDIDYSSASAQEVVKDFEAIAKSLSI